MNEKQNIGTFFDGIAATYDPLNHLLSLNEDRRWRKVAVKGMQPANHVLDVAIGTADLTLALLKHHKANRITGIDLSTEMMAIGKTKVEQHHWSDRVSFMQASALDMPFESQTFDAVTCSYGVRNFSDLDKGLREMYRVLKPNGELMILEFSYPSNRLMAWCYDLYFSHVMPFVGRVLSRNRTAYNYLNHSVKHFIWGEQMCQHLRDAGFNQVQAQTLSFGITTIYRAIKVLPSTSVKNN